MFLIADTEKALFLYLDGMMEITAHLIMSASANQNVILFQGLHGNALEMTKY